MNTFWNEWMKKNNWMKEWINAWIHEWINEWVNECRLQCILVFILKTRPLSMDLCGSLWISVDPSSLLICNNRWCSTQPLINSLSALRGDAGFDSAHSSEVWSHTNWPRLALSPAGCSRLQWTPAERGPPYWAEGPSILSTRWDSLCTAGRSCLC